MIEVVEHEGIPVLMKDGECIVALTEAHKRQYREAGEAMFGQALIMGRGLDEVTRWAAQNASVTVVEIDPDILAMPGQIEGVTYVLGDARDYPADGFDSVYWDIWEKFDPESVAEHDQIVGEGHESLLKQYRRENG